jgi:hypothetical protein
VASTDGHAEAAVPKSRKITARCAMHGPLKLFSYVVILLMVIALLYSGYTSIKYWSGIGV